MTDPQHEETFADTERKLREIITALRAQLAEAQRLMRLERTIADKNADRAERAEAALAAQIEVDAGLLQTVADNWSCGCANSWYCRCAEAAEQWGYAADAIRNQPHDRTALDRMLTEARGKALREAAEILDDEGWLGMSLHRIRALIEAHNAR